ncbi:efflux RND transporter periplasmic adaptor subunit [Flavobacterium arcticum]|uniref:Efflux RND transporter periplasmic adaptor subunit n=1 Tax=Flavobacterium arcticum TaxID=1784713 RepID=A0A345HBM9_9FLAO|nr:efflux RND transporter periplasmic adaptor subunit [Flavobacterium arcticum]AXG73989.1 efflux RND transporter periplasmic adaptor subunit [Flavobacterium arcticum]KAF2508967.1 efflux RND transporter periplasmic adaptor subunit [Flavobacterium arcticum]
MKKRSFLGAIAALLIVSACGKKEQQAPQAQGPIPFPVQTIAPQDAIIYEEYTANLEGQQNVEIRPKVDGFIQKIYVTEGQQVKKGQLLFKIETQSLGQEAAAAKANVNAAQVEVDRLQPLVKRNIISNVQLETAKAKLAQAKAAYSSVATNAGYGTITSPVNGVVGSLPYREGSLVSATNTMPLTTVSDSKVMHAYFSMNEKQMLNFTRNFSGSTLEAKLKNTPEVSLVLVDGSEYAEKGKLITVSGLVNSSTGTSEFKAAFPNPDAVLRSGGSGIVRIPVQKGGALLVPQNAVIDMQGKKMLYVVDKENKVAPRIIETSTTAGKDYIVSGGLEAGEVIVTAGATKLKEGQQIVPQDSSKQSTPAKEEVATEETTNSSQKK